MQESNKQIQTGGTFLKIPNKHSAKLPRRGKTRHYQKLTQIRGDERDMRAKYNVCGAFKSGIEGQKRHGWNTGEI